MGQKRLHISYDLIFDLKPNLDSSFECPWSCL